MINFAIITNNYIDSDSALALCMIHGQKTVEMTISPSTTPNATKSHPTVSKDGHTSGALPHVNMAVTNKSELLHKKVANCSIWSVFDYCC